MVTTFGFNYRHEILLTIVVGDVSDADLRCLIDELALQAKKLSPASVIIDFSEARVNLSTDVLWSAAQSPSPFADETLRFLVAADLHTFGMARMYQMMAGPSREKLSVVRSSDEALAALNVQDPLFEPVDSAHEPCICN